MRHFIFLMLCFIIVETKGSAQPLSKAVSYPLSTEHILHSKFNGRNYYISVILPLSFKEKDTTHYPVFFILDGQLNLPLVASQFRRTNRGKAGDVILVGIGYCPFGSWDSTQCNNNECNTIACTQYGVNCCRIYDFTPPTYPYSDSANQLLQRSWPGAGKADLFIRAIKEEIIPFVETHYRTSKDRGIQGHSLAGLFVNYILFKDPDLFSRYAITDPGLSWDNGSIFQLEKDFHDKRDKLSKKIYFGTDGNLSPYVNADVYRMAVALCSKYDGIDVTVETFENEDHSSPFPLLKALKVLYPFRENQYKGSHVCGQPENVRQ